MCLFVKQNADIRRLEIESEFARQARKQTTKYFLAYLLTHKGFIGSSLEKIPDVTSLSLEDRTTISPNSKLRLIYPKNFVENEKTFLHGELVDIACVPGDRIFYFTNTPLIELNERSKAITRYAVFVRNGVIRALLDDSESFYGG